MVTPAAIVHGDRARLLDHAAGPSDGHTWSCHDPDLSPHWLARLKPLRRANWPDQEVRFPRHARRLATGYGSLDGAALADAVARSGAEIRWNSDIALLDEQGATLSCGTRIEAGATSAEDGPAPMIQLSAGRPGSGRPIDAVLREAEKLVAAGTKELLVISQDTSAYGLDLRHAAYPLKGGGEVRAHMTDLARELGRIAPWVRLHYVYPYPHVDQVIPLMAEGLVLPYLDIPFQHASPKVLKSMKRPAFEDKTLARIKRWREICPEIVVRSTFIAGFPGETEEEFAHLLNFVQEAGIDRAGCFAYSPVEGATANEIAEARRAGLYPWVATQKERFVRITPQSMTGRRFVFGPEPDVIGLSR